MTSEFDPDQILTTRTKGLRLRLTTTLAQLRQQLHNQPLPLTNDLFAWPLLAMDDDALAHNVATMASLCQQRGVRHAPHVKTPMSAQLWARQEAAGAWAATVATPHQMRTAISWGARRVLMANQLLDVRDAKWIAEALAADVGLEVWLQVDSPEGIELLRQVFAGKTAQPHVLVELGVPGPSGRSTSRATGRTGVRGTGNLVNLAQAVIEAGLTLGGVTGYEAPAAMGDDAKANAAAVAAWCDDLAGAARAVLAIATDGGEFIVSAGGSNYPDVVLDRLAPSPSGESSIGDVPLVLRSGAYITHDHGHYAEINPWARLPGGDWQMRPAITVWAQVISTPQPGLAFLNVGRRDVPSDQGLPVVLWRRDYGDGQLGPRVDLAPGHITVTELNDQHAFLGGPGVAGLRPGDVVGLGISHPCTAFDKWRVGLVTKDDPTGQTMAIDLYSFDF